MQAGKLRHRVTIQSSVVTQNAHGQDETTWSTFASRHAAEVTQLTGRELWNAQQIKPDISLRVSMRWLPGVLPKMRVVWHDGTTDRLLPIESPPVNPDGKKREMVLYCKESC